ncbi:MAG: hypothetical protein CM1200mP30_14040 [Pseudomonadota bacterium]|nr:MAG: hypothetical protein CM1200mP30_14040 [Pseudomonadota bacterium]
MSFDRPECFSNLILRRGRRWAGPWGKKTSMMNKGHEGKKMSTVMRKKTSMVMTILMNMAMRIQKKEKFILNSGQTIPGIVFIQMR